jgi:hypothetical protein
MPKKALAKLKANLLGTNSKPAGKPDYKNGLNSGASCFNLALTGKISVGWLPGALYHFVGDSNSGKTFLCLNAFAEAARTPFYDDYRLVYDGPEGGAKMDIRKFYGAKVEQRLEAPSPAGCSKTLEDLYYNLWEAFKSGKKFIWIVDSITALQPMAAQKKFEQELKAARKIKKKEGEEEEKLKGSFGVEKAKQNSANLGWITHKLQQSGSILVLISQTRATIGHAAQFKPRTRAGGEALTFYSDIEIWSSVREKLKKPVRGKKMEIGTRCQIHVTRTRLTGRDRTVFVPIYNSYGVDDVGSMVDFLVDSEHWAYEGSIKERDKIKIAAPEFKYDGKREGLIQLIEGQNKERELRLLTSQVWQEIEAELAVKRKPRYT